MKKLLFLFASLCISGISFAQCPDIIYAMVNSCGATIPGTTNTYEGYNEFVVFNTSVASTVDKYSLIYNSVTPPFSSDPSTPPKALSGSKASIKLGTGSISTTAGTCGIIEVTSPSTNIPANSRVLFITDSLDQNYDVTGLCNGNNPIYVVYINTDASSNWSPSGNFANSTSGTNTLRYLQLIVSGSSTCAGVDGGGLFTLAPIKSFNTFKTGTTNTWASNADGNAVTWNGTTASYNNSGCTSPVLPVSMIDLTASNTKDANIIKWRTVQELNTEKFILERSFDGKNFSPVSNIAAIGSNSNNYQFTDKISEYKTTYYRIKTIDKSGKSVYSRIVKVVPSRSNLTVSNIYPNPAKENISVEWNSLTKAKATVKIIDVTGRVLQTENTMALTGYNKRTLNVNNLPPGKYIIQIATDQDVVTASFNK
ncbi:MAG: T9SS type A sorting domain-containing protein [Ferruginibacter sp.]|nr:T9SS type A sorting domain-containing protein [Ferruginibacter sp.]